MLSQVMLLHNLVQINVKKDISAHEAGTGGISVSTSPISVALIFCSSASLNLGNLKKTPTKAESITMIPNMSKVSLSEWPPNKKRNPHIMAPVFPPAPTIPDTAPVTGGSTYGTKAKLVPSAHWTPMEKSTITPTAAPKVVALEKAINIRPSYKRIPQCVIMRAFKEWFLFKKVKFLLAKSEIIPPKARANRFMRPKRDPTKPAISNDWPNSST
mmetsp:Transcript_18764/g.27139  ORF Transcript_18764/g.27139 Transcript_18764/m.27139 type:complete len:214 (-) Transcript_18764:229-870(-)